MRSTVAGRSALCAAALALLFTAGCMNRDANWSHPDIPAEEWSADASQCRYEANRQAEDEYLQDNGYTEDVNLSEDSVDAYFSRSDIKKRARQLFGYCMRSLGYVTEE